MYNVHLYLGIYDPLQNIQREQKKKHSFGGACSPINISVLNRVRISVRTRGKPSCKVPTVYKRTCSGNKQYIRHDNTYNNNYDDDDDDDAYVRLHYYRIIIIRVSTPKRIEIFSAVGRLITPVIVPSVPRIDVNTARRFVSGGYLRH